MDKKKIRRAGVTAALTGAGALAGNYIAHKTGVPADADYWHKNIADVTAMGATGGFAAAKAGMSMLRHSALNDRQKWGR